MPLTGACLRRRRPPLPPHGLSCQCQTGRSKAGDWDAARYSKNAGFVPELGKHVLDLLAPRYL